MKTSTMIALPLAAWLLWDTASFWLPADRYIPVVSWFRREWKKNPQAQATHTAVLSDLLIFAIVVYQLIMDKDEPNAIRLPTRGERAKIEGGMERMMQSDAEGHEKCTMTLLTKAPPPPWSSPEFKDRSTCRLTPEAYLEMKEAVLAELDIPVDESWRVDTDGQCDSSNYCPDACALFVRADKFHSDELELCQTDIEQCARLRARGLSPYGLPAPPDEPSEGFPPELIVVIVLIPLLLSCCLGVWCIKKRKARDDSLTLQEFEDLHKRDPRMRNPRKGPPTEPAFKPIGDAQRSGHTTSGHDVELEVIEDDHEHGTPVQSPLSATGEHSRDWHGDMDTSAFTMSPTYGASARRQRMMEASKSSMPVAAQRSVLGLRQKDSDGPRPPGSPTALPVPPLRSTRKGTGAGPLEDGFGSQRGAENASSPHNVANHSISSRYNGSIRGSPQLNASGNGAANGSFHTSNYSLPQAQGGTPSPSASWRGGKARNAMHNF